VYVSRGTVSVSSRFLCGIETGSPFLTKRLFNNLQSSKVVFSPASLKNNDAPERADRKGIGFFVAGNGHTATIGVIEAAMTSGRSYMNFLATLRSWTKPDLQVFTTSISL
jgi:hypothetical protein